MSERIEVSVPIMTVSEANVREHWAKRAKRAKAQRLVIGLRLSGAGRVTPPATVTMCRIGKRRLDGDNLQRALKAVRDGVADWLGVDDGSAQVEWHYEQECGLEYAVRVTVEVP